MSANRQDAGIGAVRDTQPHVMAGSTAAIMADRRIRHLLVCGANRQLVGIISDRDIKERTGETAGDIMTRDPLTVSPQTPVAPAITLMISKGISCLPVLSQKGELRGILTTTDLLLTLQCTLQVLAQIVSGLHLPAAAAAKITEQSPTCSTEVAEPEPEPEWASDVGSTTPLVGSQP